MVVAGAPLGPSFSADDGRTSSQGRVVTHHWSGPKLPPTSGPRWRFIIVSTEVRWPHQGPAVPSVRRPRLIASLYPTLAAGAAVRGRERGVEGECCAVCATSAPCASTQQPTLQPSPAHSHGTATTQRLPTSLPPSVRMYQLNHPRQALLIRRPRALLLPCYANNTNFGCYHYGVCCSTTTLPPHVRTCCMCTSLSWWCRPSPRAATP